MDSWPIKEGSKAYAPPRQLKSKKVVSINAPPIAAAFSILWFVPVYIRHTFHLSKT